MDNSQDIQNEESGIRSLSGFAYQIRVFLYYMSKIGEEDQIEFETLEDVVVNKLSLGKSIDHKSGSFSSLFKSINEYYAIQVKRTKITKSSKNQLLFNWLILESRGIEISKYILYTEEVYGNTENIFDVSCGDLYKLVMATGKKVNSSIGKAKSIYWNNPNGFQEAYEKIKNNFEFVSEGNINGEILEGYALHFRRGGISELYFELRVRELIQDITGEIMDAIYNKRSFTCDYKNMMRKIEDISERIKQNHYEPDFASFKKINQLNLSDETILESREYLQLVKCGFSETRIEDHLIFQQYYENIRYRLLEDNKLNRIVNIETTTFENFCSVKENLGLDEQDSPGKRLLETKKMDNYYALQNQTRYGSCIYLTKNDIEDNIKISWEDDNE